MGRIWIDGFEYGGATTFLGGIYTASGMTALGTPRAGFSGNYYLNAGSGFSYIQKELDAALSEIYAAIKVYPQVRTSDGPGVLGFYDSAGTAIMGIKFYYDGSTYFYIRAERGAQSSGNILGTGLIPILPSTAVHLVEVYYKPLNSGGICRVRLNGVLDINYTGDTTAGLENVKKVRVGYAGRDNYLSQYDDFVLDDSQRIGNTRIQKLQISGAGTTGEWDASAGNPYECVDEIPFSDTDFISTNVPGEIATFACGDMTGNVSSVKALLLHGRMLYEGNPAPNKQKLAIRVNGTNYFSGRFTPGLSAAPFQKLWAVNPDDSQPWEEADINAIEIGVQAVQMTSTSTTSTTTTTP